MMTKRVSKHMPVTALGFVGLVTALAAGVGVVGGDRVGAQQGAVPAAVVERGRYLVRVTGCHDCHSPKIKGMEPDLTRSLAGRPATTPLPSKTTTEVHASLDLTAWTGPWGQSVASNLTPDAATGLGNRYTEASFIQTMRTGKKPNGTQLMPPMPSDVYQNMTDDDLRAIFAYLRSIKPIRNAVFAGLPPPTPAAAPK